MKKIFLSALLLISSMCIFTACDDDRDSNPTIQEPETFVLNTPAYAASEIDLASSKKINFTCSQPEFGYTAAATYQIQISLNNSFTLSANEAEEDEVPDYAVVDEAYTSCNIASDAALFAKAVMQVGKWEEEDVPALQTINVRLVANVDKYSVASNTVDMKVIPYYIELKDALPQLWYMVGTAVGTWDNKIGTEGELLIPVALAKNAEYDKATGQGEFTYTGYFCGDQLKFIQTPGQWAPQWGETFRPTEDVADPSPISIAPVGYYTVTFNNTNGAAKTEINVKAYEGDAPKVFTNWELVGEFNNWGSDGILKLKQNASVKHIWYEDVEFSKDGGVKFRSDADWSDECGGNTFPYGLKTGDNIPVKAGKYRVVFNDIDRCYYFFVKE